MHQEPRTSQPRIADKLNTMGYRTRTGLKWNSRFISKILTRPADYGEWHYTSEAENILVDIPSMITKETFDKVQKLLEQRRLGAEGIRKYDYLFLDYLYCGVCGRRMTGQSKRTVVKTRNKVYGPYLEQYCSCYVRRLKKGCTMAWIRKDTIDSLLDGKSNDISKTPLS